MGEEERSQEIEVAALRAILKSQYHAALEMLKEAIERCPETLWFSQAHPNACWQIAYHTLFFTHLYLQPSGDAFEPWEYHQPDVQHPDGVAGPVDPESPLPLLPEPYARAQVLAYWLYCDEIVDDAVDVLDLCSQESGFSWYQVSKLEHQLINLRHIAHHTAQLADRLRAAEDFGVHWVGARPHAAQTLEE